MSEIKIDVHAHIFNSRDIPIYGVVKNFDIPFVPTIIERPVLAAVGRLVQLYYRYTTEDENKLTNLFLESEVLNDDNSDEILENLRIVDNDFNQMLNDIDNQILSLSDSDLEINSEDFEMFLEDGGESFEKGLGSMAAKYAIKIAVKKLLKNLINWLKLLGKNRETITRDLISTYKNVDFFVPLMMDMDKWFDGGSETPFSTQIEEISTLIVKMEGRIHPFVAYDPRRARDEGVTQTLDAIRDCIFNKGFIGVKLYPPMGYKPLDEGYVDALRPLYEMCHAEDIPITAHCTPRGMEANSRENSGENANPKYWKPVLGLYPNLRLNLAHFGGFDNLLKPGDDSWAETIIEMMRVYDNLYSDTGHHHLRSKKMRNKVQSKLKPLFQNSNLVDRYLFGTDWHMIVRQSGSKDFLSVYREFYETLGFSDTNSAIRKFSGENAVNFLGLKPGNKTRERLEIFYRNNSIATPAWMGKIT